jgi:site-specific recombinase
MTSEERIEREFLQVATRRSQFLRAGEPKKANRQYDKLYKMKARLRQLPDRGEAALKRIAATNDTEIQIMAAGLLLAVDEDFAIELLERIRDDDPGLASFTAKMTLQEWRKGAIREYLS